jgi:hypothetical protein
MQPHNPASRRLLCGILAGLFGWLATGKGQAQAPLPSVSPQAPVQGTLEGYTSSISYDGSGKCIASSGQLLCAGVSFNYDGNGRLTSVTDHG